MPCRCSRHGLGMLEAFRGVCEPRTFYETARIHSGPVVAGVIGNTNFHMTYGVTPSIQPVGVSLRTLSSPRVSQHTPCSKIVTDLQIGEMMVKGKGMQQTYFLLGRSEDSS